MEFWWASRLQGDSLEIGPQSQNTGIEGFQRLGSSRKLGGTLWVQVEYSGKLGSANWALVKLWSLFYRWWKSILAVSANRDSKWMDGMVAEDQWMELVGTCSWMIQVSGGASPDRREPMASEGEVGHGDWSA